MRTFAPVVLAFCFLANLCSAQLSDRNSPLSDRNYGTRGPQDRSLPPRMNNVSGVVLGSDGKPIPDVHIEIRAEDTGTTIVSGYTNDAGTFAFENLPTTSYEVVATR